MGEAETSIPNPLAYRQALVGAARGDHPFDLVIASARLINVFTLEITPVDVGVVGRHIAYVGPAGAESLRAHARLEAEGRWLAPGFIDCHVHIESSMLTPANFARAVLPRGTTTIYADPHELANVLGLAGVRYVLDASAGVPLRINVQAPSCVPSVLDLEHAGASFDGEDIAEMLRWPGVLGVAEVMDFMGVINGAPRMQRVVHAGLAAGALVSGHAPTVSGRALQAYLAAGVDSDHESTLVEEIVEKLRAGMVVEGRESSFIHNMAALAEAIRQVPAASNVVLCTDDIDALDIQRVGHMDNVVRAGIAAGLDPALVIRYATLHGAQRLRQYDLGAVATGRRADMVLLDDLSSVKVHATFVDGQLVARDGRVVVAIEDPVPDYPGGNTVRLPRLSVADFQLHAPVASGTVEVQAVDCTDQVLFSHVTTLQLPVRDGIVQVGDPVALEAIVQRHGMNTPPALAPIKGFGITRGAVASTVSHDSHNLAIVGANPDDMLLAAQTLARCGGGIVAVADGKVLALVELPIAGLLSPLAAEHLAPSIDQLKDACQALGIRGQNPMLTIATTALIVIPEVRMSNIGLIDVLNQRTIPVFAGQLGKRGRRPVRGRDGG